MKTENLLKFILLTSAIGVMSASCDQRTATQLKNNSSAPSPAATSTLTPNQPTPQTGHEVAKKSFQANNTPATASPSAASSPKQNSGSSTTPQNFKDYNYNYRTSTDSNATQSETFTQSSQSSINFNLSSKDIPVGRVGQPYSVSIPFSQSGNQQFFVEFKNLPEGIKLSGSTDGFSKTITNPGSSVSLVLDGVPKAAGESNVIVTLNNNQGSKITNNFNLQVTP